MDAEGGVARRWWWELEEVGRRPASVAWRWMGACGRKLVVAAVDEDALAGGGGGEVVEKGEDDDGEVGGVHG